MNSDKVLDLLRQSFPRSNVTFLDSNLIYRLSNADGSISIIAVFDDLAEANLISSFKHQNLPRMGEISRLGNIFICPIEDLGTNLEWFMVNQEIDHSSIPVENKIKWAWQILQLAFELSERGYQLNYSTETIYFSGPLELPGTDVIVYDYSPHFNGRQGNISTRNEPDLQSVSALAENFSALKHTIFSLFVDTTEHSSLDFINQTLPANYPSKFELMQFFQLLQTRAFNRATIESLPIFQGLSKTPLENLPIVGFTETPSIDFLPTLVEVAAKSRFNMQTLFAAIDLWYRCGNLTRTQDQAMLAYSILFLIDEVFNNLMTSPHMKTVRDRLYPNRPNSEFLPPLFDLIAQKVKFAFYRPYLYEAATGANQVIASYTYVIPYPDVYTRVDITAWYQQIPSDGEDKNMLASTALQID